MPVQGVYRIEKTEDNMKGNDKVIEMLNARLAEELAAVNQYMVHSEMADNWGYGRLHSAFEKRAIEEMKHAEKLIGRILFLEGRPMVSHQAPIHIGDTVEAQHARDQAAEADAVKIYNDNIRTAVELGDNGTREMLESILREEEAHLDWIEAQLDQIGQMGLQNYLEKQVG
jgi:bacterioferritin